MNTICHIIILILGQFSLVGLASELCLNKENTKTLNSKSEIKSCKWIDPEKPSIVVKDTAGRLGNVMFGYLNLLFLKVSSVLSDHLHILCWIYKYFEFKL